MHYECVPTMKHCAGKFIKKKKEKKKKNHIIDSNPWLHMIIKYASKFFIVLH